MIVAPNSPRLRANESSAPVTMPGSASGSVIDANTQAREPPSVRATVSSRRSIAAIDRRIARTISGKPMIAAASAAPVQRNANTMPNQSASHAPSTPLVAEEQQQGEADDDRRQHQRQMDERIEQRLAGKIGAREHVGEENRRRQAAGDADQRHLQAQDDDAEFDAARHDVR